MAKKQQRPYARQNVVLQVPLLADSVPTVEKYLKDSQIVEDLLTSALLKGYTFTIAYSEKTNDYSCQMRAVFDDMMNAGNSIYGNGDNWYTSLVVVLVKHFFQCEGGLWEEKAASDLPKYR